MDNTWHDIVNYEGLYKINALGEVMSVRRNKVMTLNRNKDGYLQVNLSKTPFIYKTYRVHRLVAMNFIPNPLNKKEINHINGKRDDNRIENLEWSTRTEQMLHSYRVLKTYRYKPGCHKQKVNVILHNGDSLEFNGCIDAAKHFNVRPAYISAHITGRLKKSIKFKAIHKIMQ